MANNSFSSFPRAFCHFPLASALGLFLSRSLYLCPGFAPLLLSAHFCKSSARPLQPTQPGRVHRDQRSVGMHTHFLFLSHTHTHVSPPHLCPSAPSRSLQSMDALRDVPPPLLPSVSRSFEALYSLTEKLWTWKDFPTDDFQSSHHQDHRHRGRSLISWGSQGGKTITKECRLACRQSIQISSFVALQCLFLTAEAEWGVIVCLPPTLTHKQPVKRFF